VSILSIATVSIFAGRKVVNQAKRTITINLQLLEAFYMFILEACGFVSIGIFKEVYILEISNAI
jgi:hypothetical protein